MIAHRSTSSVGVRRDQDARGANNQSRGLAPRTRFRRGWMVAEAIAGLAIVAAMTLMFAVALNRHHRALDRLQSSEQSLHLAEQALAALQLGASAPAPPAGATVHVRRLATTAPADLAWARVEVVDHGRITELSGIVKSSAFAGAQK